jgi:hypothetical protein
MLDRLAAARVPLAGVIVNRAHLWPAAGPTPDRVPAEGCDDAATNALAAALAASAAPDFPSEAAARAALASADGYAAWVRADAESTARLEARATRNGGFVRRIPELAGDVHDLEGLAHVAGWLFGREGA